LLLAYALSSVHGRAQFAAVGPWVAGVVVMALLFPYLIWLDLSGSAVLPDAAAIVRNVHGWGWLAGALLVGHLGMALLIAIGRGYLTTSRDAPPEVVRAPVAPAGRRYVYFFALAPVVAIGLFALFASRPENFVGEPLVVLSGLAAIVAAGDRIRIERQYLIGVVWAALLVLPPLFVALAIVLNPWTVAADLRVGRPAAEIGRFFADSFQRRTGQPLAIVTGDPSLASLVSLMAPSRPSLFLESAPKYLPRVSRADLDAKGMVVIWPAADPAGRPPPEVARQFPGLAAEVPQSFERRFQGLMPLMRVGWAVVRPGAQPPLVAPQ
jgi:hypothetical protein